MSNFLVPCSLVLILAHYYLSDIFSYFYSYSGISEPGTNPGGHSYYTPFSHSRRVILVELLGVYLVSLPIMCYTALRLRWPSHSKALQITPILLFFTLTLRSLLYLEMRSADNALLFAFFLLLGAFGYGLMQLSDFLIVRHLWLRHPKLPHPLRQITAYLIPILLAIVADEALKTHNRSVINFNDTSRLNHIEPNNSDSATLKFLQLPTFKQSTPPPNVPQDQPSKQQPVLAPPSPAKP